MLVGVMETFQHGGLGCTVFEEQLYFNTLKKPLIHRVYI